MVERKRSAKGSSDLWPPGTTDYMHQGTYSQRSRPLLPPLKRNISYRLLDAIEANRQKKEAAKSGAVQHGNQYMPATSQSVQPIPIQVQPSPAPQVLVHAQDPDGQKTPKVELPQTFPVPFRSNGAHTPIPSQSTHQFINQCPSTAPHGSVAQPQVYANLQTAQDAANNQAPTPAQQIHMQPPQIQHYQQHYVQQYQFQSQQSLQQHQATTQTIQPQLSRPPSQPQQQPAQNTSIQPSQSRLSPNTSTQQVVPQQMQPQRFTHTPKPPQVQPTVMQPTQTSQQYSGNANSFQGSAHNTHFLQHSGTSVRPAQKSQSGPIQDSQPPLPPNATPAQVAQAQHIYSQQMNQYNQSQQQQQGQQPGSQRLLLQRMAQSSSGGRTTPAQAQQSPGLQPQQVHQTRAVTATPSPVKGSPVFNQTTVAVGSPAGVSPMQAKAQVPIQQAGNGQQHTQPIQHLQGQQLPNSGPQRIQFQPQYNPSHLRPLIHGNPQTAHASPSGVSVSATPNLAHASPVVGGRPITPVINADIKQPGPGQQLPLRRPTPLQQQATVAQMTQMQAHAQKQQAPQIQVQQLPQAQGQQPFTQSHVPTAPTPPQVQQTPVQQAAQIPNAQQLAAYPQLYNYQMQQFWRNSQQQQLQQGQGQANPAVAAGQASLPQQQVTSMTPQQAAALQHQHQHNLQVALIQQLTQQAQAHGQSLTPSQIQLYVHQKLHMMAQAQAQAGGQQQAQGAQQNQQIGQQAQITPARAQALMMGKIQMPVGSQMYGQQGHVQGGPGQSANMRLQVQQQQAAAVAQAQVGQKGKPVAGLPKKGPTR